MFYLTGEVGRTSHKGSFAAGDERVSVQVLDMGQNIWIGSGEVDIMGSLLDLHRGDQITVPCEVNPGSKGGLFVALVGPATVTARAAQIKAQAKAS